MPVALSSGLFIARPDGGLRKLEEAGGLGVSVKLAPPSRLLAEDPGQVSASHNGERALIGGLGSFVVVAGDGVRTSNCELPRRKDAPPLIQKVALGGDHALLQLQGAAIEVWSISRSAAVGALTGRARPQRDGVAALALSPAGTLAATAGYDGTLLLHALPSREVVRVLHGWSECDQLAFADEATLLVLRGSQLELRDLEGRVLAATTTTGRAHRSALDALRGRALVTRGDQIWLHDLRSSNPIAHATLPAPIAACALGETSVGLTFGADGWAVGALREAGDGGVGA